MLQRNKISNKKTFKLYKPLDFMDEPDNINNGSISEWNEGNFKNLRLHEAQEMINMGKVNPFSYSENETAWSYQIWKAGIDILYGEGASKYSTGEKSEVEQVEMIKNFVERYLSIKPPFRKITEYHIDSKQDKFIPIKENQQKIKKALEIYEKIVKKFNDKHGLSTRNRDDDDWRGL